MTLIASQAAPMPAESRARLTSPVIGVIAFLTVVDLFATQAILPALATAYGVSSATMGLAVNACAAGMAIAGLACAFLPARIDRRRWIAGALAVLALPTAALAVMPPLGVFAALRIVQGLCMATAFALTLAHLGEACSARAASGAFAAFIAGNVASNLLGRFVAASAAEALGIAGNFLLFAALNLFGAALVLLVLRRRPAGMATMAVSPIFVWHMHLRNRVLRLLLMVGFCILLVFLGVFTFVSFVLARPPFALHPMMSGAIYLVFLPAVFTTALAGRAAGLLGRRRALLTALAVAAAGLPPLLSDNLPVFLAGLVLVGVGTFLAQAIATRAVSEAAMGHRAAASGMYLCAYYLGGLIGTALLGRVFISLGWPVTVACLALALLVAASAAALLPSTPANSVPSYH